MSAVEILWLPCPARMPYTGSVPTARWQPLSLKGFAIGTKPDGSQWSGGVENPWNASDVYTASSSYVSGVNMSDMALVTSGNYQRYYVVDGVRYHHLIDPDTLWPARYFDSVSVLSPDSGAADCLATGLFCMSLEDGQKLIESLDGVEALWCTPDGEVIQSSGWADHEKK